MDQADLLAQARAGDRAAVARLVMDEQRVLRAYLARLAPDPTTADDLAQETFLIAIRSLDRVDPEQGLRGYLLGIARNLARQAWRTHDRRREIGGGVMEALEAQIDPVEGETEDRRLAALRICLQRLAPRALEVVLSHYRDDLRCDEIASRFGLAVSSVRVALSRARTILRQCVGAAAESSR